MRGLPQKVLRQSNRYGTRQGQSEVSEVWQHESGTAVGGILRHDFQEKLSVVRFSRDESLFACWSWFLWHSHSSVLPL